MFRYFIGKGALLGMVTGLVTTVFESIFSSHLCVYVPWTYPLELVAFNMLFWIVCGGLAGFFLWGIKFRKESTKDNEGYYWGLFYLFPFTVVYVLLGNISYVKHIKLLSFQASNLSYALIVIVPLFVVLFRKRFAAIKKGALSFLPEIVFIVAFCWLGTNLTVFMEQFKFLGILKNFSSVGEDTSILINVGGGSIASVIYCVVFFKRSCAVQKQFIGVTALLITAILFATGSLWTNRFISSFIVPKLSIKAAPRQLLNAGDAKAVLPNVIVLVLDTVRSNRLPQYNTSIRHSYPHFDTLANEAVVFEKCIAPSGWTAPSHASLFTGLYPIEHAVRSGVDGASCLRTLQDQFVTMAEYFSSNGYDTAAVVSNRGILGPWTNMHQGFQEYSFENGIGCIPGIYRFKPLMPLFCFLTNVRPKYFLYYRTAEDINERIYGILNKAAEPFFLFVNYMDAHSPYYPPRPFCHSNFPQLAKLKESVLRRLGSKMQNSYLSTIDLFQYDGEIAYLDDRLGGLFAYLKRQGFYDSSLVIVTSDHGEMFGEHGMRGHGEKVFLYEEVLKVPLIMKYPGSRKRGREAKAISLPTLYPAILSICGLPIPECFSNRKDGSQTSPIVSEQYLYEQGTHRVLYDGNYKYFTYEKKRNSELYDIKNDPYEKEDLAALFPDTALQMKNRLELWLEEHPEQVEREPPEAAPSNELMQGLKALGYIQ